MLSIEGSGFDSFHCLTQYIFLITLISLFASLIVRLKISSSKLLCLWCWTLAMGLIRPWSNFGDYEAYYTFRQMARRVWSVHLEVFRFARVVVDLETAEPLRH